jgi:hypothetical protein
MDPDPLTRLNPDPQPWTREQRVYFKESIKQKILRTAWHKFFLLFPILFVIQVHKYTNESYLSVIISFRFTDIGIRHKSNPVI